MQHEIMFLVVAEFSSFQPLRRKDDGEFSQDPVEYCTVLYWKSWNSKFPARASPPSTLETGCSASSLIGTLVSFISTLLGLMIFLTRATNRARSMLVLLVSDAVRREPEPALR